MSKIYLLIIIFIAAASELYSQYAWSEMIYHFQTGSIPPPYYYSYDLNINSDGNAILVCTPGYKNDTTWRYNINIDANSLNNLNEEILTSKVLTEDIQSLPDNKRPIGGSLQNIMIVLNDTNPNLDRPPKRIITPFFPANEYRERLDVLYKFVKSLVPDSVWTDFDRQREDFTKKHK